MPLIIYDSSGTNEVWNSDNVSGGVFAAVKTYAASATDTLTFPQFAGRNAQIVNLKPYYRGGSALGVSLDFSLGYPRVTVSTASLDRRFAVVVY